MNDENEPIPQPENEDPRSVPIPRVPEDMPVFSQEDFQGLEKQLDSALADAGFPQAPQANNEAPKAGTDGRPIPQDRTMAELGRDNDKPLEIRGMDELLRVVREMNEELSSIKAKVFTLGN